MDDVELRFPGPVASCLDRRLPEVATPAGYAALIAGYSLRVPVPLTLCAIAARHRAYEDAGWRLFTPRYAPDPSLPGHLVFALKYEGLDLAVLARLFGRVGPRPIEEWVRAQPTGRYARRIWFLYEWLRGERLDLPDLTRASYVEVVDPALQWAGSARNSPRHRVHDNLPGTPDFCPLVRRTPELQALVAAGLAERARAITARVPADLLARTAAFLLLQDSRASYVLEGESPPQDRIQRWGHAIGQAGRQPLDLEELLRLQAIVLGEARFTKLGLRTSGGFVGQHDRDTRTPLPDHISARPEDLPGLVEGLLHFDREHARDLDPVVAAAVLAFGFVFIHPFEDGNGRIHRYLFHHVLTARGFSPKNVVFPVSSTILARVDEYRSVLENYSKRVLPCIDWRATELGNVEVTNDTADFYRYFDATEQARFLYDCVRRTIEHDLPEEAERLRRYDAFHAAVEAIVEMPDRTVDLLHRMLVQNDGRLSRRAREREFAALTEDEVARIEAAYGATFRG